MNFQFRNFSAAQVFFGAVVLLVAAALGTGFATLPGALRQTAQVGSALGAVSMTVRVSEIEIDCESPTDPATHVFFDILPKEGGEFTVVDHGYVRKFDALASYEEAGLDGYFSNGSYEGLLTAKPGYTLAISAFVPFTVASRCGELSPAPLPLPEPTSTTPVLTTTPALPPVTGQPPTVKTTTTEPASAMQGGGVPTETPTIVLPLATCGSAEECAQVCSAKGGTKSCEAFVAQAVVSTPLSTLPAEQLNEGFREKTMEMYLTERSGVRAFSDSDQDGIADFDEVNIYGTDPKSGDTDKDGVSDGDELLANTDPMSTAAVGSKVPIVFEDPKLYGTSASSTLVVLDIVAEKSTADAEGAERIFALTLSGKAPANSFITIFVYSEPIVVTIKTDEFGAWTYTLDKELADGSHEVFAAVADSKGRVWAKSSPLPFVKTAAAVSVGSAALLPTAPSAPTFFGGRGTIVMVGVFMLIVVASVLVMGLRRREDTTTS